MKNITKNTIARFSIVSAAVILTACGGGGGGDDSTASSVTPPAAQTPSTLSTTILGTTYASGSAEQINYNRLNAVRLAGGFGTVAQDPVIDMAALSHAKYVASNYLLNPTNLASFDLTDPATGQMNAHVENPTWTGFTGILPENRIAAAGNNQYSGAGEVMAFNTNESCVDDLLNTVFHRSAILQPITQSVGFGLYTYVQTTGLDPFTGSTHSSDAYSCAIEYGYKGNGNVAPADWIGVYPGVTQTNVPVGMPFGESPDPYPSIPNASKGYPVSIYFANPIGLVSSFTITATGSSVPVPVKLILQKDFPVYMNDMEAHILPTQSLAKGTTYDVSFVGTLADGKQVRKIWSFTTTVN